MNATIKLNEEELRGVLAQVWKVEIADVKIVIISELRERYVAGEAPPAHRPASMTVEITIPVDPPVIRHIEEDNP